MRYQVPQFIDVEDKIFGPLTFKQFLYLGGGIGLGYICYVYIPTILSLPFAIGAVGLGVCLAFVKINKKPFVYMVQAFLLYLFNPKLYVWSKVQKKKREEEVREEGKKQQSESTPVDKQTLKDLAWSLDIHNRNSK